MSFNAFVLVSIFIFKRKSPLEFSAPLQQNRNLDIITSVPQGEPNSFWWIKEYSILIEKLCANPSCEVKMSYFVRDNKQVFLSLKSNSNKSILLVADVPGESQGEINASGKFVRRSGRYIYCIYDLNRDGSPDSYSEGSTLTNQTSETNIVFQDRPDVVKTWEVGIGFAINWQIHGIPSALPRN